MTKKIFGILLPDWVDEEALKKLIYSSLGLVVAVLVSILFVWPRFADLYKEEKELSKSETSLKVLSESASNVQDFGVNLGEEQLSALRLAVPDTFDPGMILSSLRQIGFKTGVTFQSYELGKGIVDVEMGNKVGLKAGEVSLKKHKINLKLVGVADNLIEFIDLLGTSVPVSVISELSLSEISKLFTVQGLSELTMELTYFESDLIGESLTDVVGFTDENKRLLDEIVVYSRPAMIQDGVSGQFGRSGSIFGF